MGEGKEAGGRWKPRLLAAVGALLLSLIPGAAAQSLASDCVSQTATFTEGSPNPLSLTIGVEFTTSASCQFTLTPSAGKAIYGVRADFASGFQPGDELHFGTSTDLQTNGERRSPAESDPFPVYRMCFLCLRASASGRLPIGPHGSLWRESTLPACLDL